MKSMSMENDEGKSKKPFQHAQDEMAFRHVKFSVMARTGANVPDYFLDQSRRS
jgi:hypothetical protein